MFISLVAIVVLGSATDGATWGAEPVAGSGVAKTEPRDVGEFDKIHVNGSPNVNIVIGPERSVSVTADDNLLAVIDTVVEDGTLVIGGNQGFRTRLGVTVQITVPALTHVAVHGSGDVTVKQLDAEKFKAEIQGSGDISVAGRAEELEVEIQGSGDVKLDELAAKRAAVEVQGSGDSTIKVSDELTVHTAGSGDVKYMGDPKVTKTGDASGDVKKVGVGSLEIGMRSEFHQPIHLDHWRLRKQRPPVLEEPLHRRVASDAFLIALIGVLVAVQHELDESVVIGLVLQ